MYIDIDEVLDLLQKTNADTVRYELEQEIKGNKYTIVIEIQTQ